ncbi:hypothetical protein ACS0TY_029578 [Phlomoides rotata]
MCKNAKEIWETLTLMCEGTDKIKEKRLSVAVQNYEKFEMLKGETIAQLDSRFTNIMNEINSLGKEFTNRDVALKIIRSLPERWDIFIVMFQNTKDLSSISSEQLFSELRAHEFDLNQRKSTATDSALEEPSTSSKGVVFKAKTEECASPAHVVHDLSKSEMIEEMNLMAKRFKKLNSRFGKYKHFYQDTRDRKRNFNYSAGKSGHRQRIRNTIVTTGTRSKRDLHQGAWNLSIGRMVEMIPTVITTASAQDTSIMNVLS